MENRPLNECLKNYRLEEKMTQDDMAKDMCVSRQTLAKYENGTSSPTVESIKKLAEKHKTSIDRIVGLSTAASIGLSAFAEEFLMVMERLDSKTQQQLLEIAKKLGEVVHFFF